MVPNSRLDAYFSSMTGLESIIYLAVGSDKYCIDEITGIDANLACHCFSDLQTYTSCYVRQ